MKNLNNKNEQDEIETNPISIIVLVCMMLAGPMFYILAEMLEEAGVEFGDFIILDILYRIHWDIFGAVDSYTISFFFIGCPVFAFILWKVFKNYFSDYE
ncbi:MAG: hypothetical protein FWG85_07945 [Bacteroidetes bacterium]|nr:hypothetical protein [Bacteroidota bacterium]